MKDNRKYIIYRILNLITRKYYIGRTCCAGGLKNRWSIHIAHAIYNYNEAPKTYIANTIKKYGKENFEIKQIHEAKSFDEMIALENFYIKYYKSTDPKYGYNIEEYDESNKKILDDSTRNKMANNTRNRRFNESKFSKNKYRNVYFSNTDRKHNPKPWSLRIKKLDQMFIKRFETEELAAEASDKLSIFLYGKESVLNFPEKLDYYLSCDLKKYADSVAYRKPTKSKYINVTQQKNSTKWMARICIGNNKRVLLGFFNTEEEAAIAHDKVEFLLNGKDSKKINFPEKLKDYQLDEIQLYYNNILTSNKQRNRVTTSKYRGVTKHGQNSLWCYELRNGKNRFRGTAKTEEEAAKQYDILAIKYLGEKAKVNFPINKQNTH